MNYLVSTLEGGGLVGTLSGVLMEAAHKPHAPELIIASVGAMVLGGVLEHFQGKTEQDQKYVWIAEPNKNSDDLGKQ